MDRCFNTTCTIRFKCKRFVGNIPTLSTQSQIFRFEQNSNKECEFFKSFQKCIEQ